MVSARGNNKSELRISTTKTRKKMTEIVLLIIYKTKKSVIVIRIIHEHQPIRN